MTTLYKNIFKKNTAGVDSDDEPIQVQKATKTQIKKEERKITEKTEKPVKINFNKMAEGGFEVVSNEKIVSRPQVDEMPRGGRGGRGRGGRGGRGRGEAFKDGERVTLNQEVIGGKPKEVRERQPFRGKPREEAHPFDR